MENSLSSSVKKSLASKGTNKEEAPEESGWTAYLQDSFLLEQQRDDSSSSCSQSGGSPSLLSDAASHAAWKFSNNQQAIEGSSAFGFQPAAATPPQKLNFKKKRSKEVYYDDSLEDTASSPVNSPKVSNLRPTDINHGKTDDSIMSCVGKGGGSDSYLELQTDERNEVNFDGNNEHYIDLKKRGLCLVPVSMLVNYFG